MTLSTALASRVESPLSPAAPSDPVEPLRGGGRSPRGGPVRGAQRPLRSGSARGAAGLRPGFELRVLLLVVLCLVVVSACALLLAPTRAQAAEPYVGLTETFWASDWTSESSPPVQVTATVQYAGEHVVIYVQNGRSVPAQIIASLGSDFDSTIYPWVTATLGAESNPGIDGQPRTVILIYDFNDLALLGSFYNADLLARTDPDPDSDPKSNQRDMFYLNLDAILAQPERADAAAAHEFAHLVMYYRHYLLAPFGQRTHQARWMEEGLAMYAELAAGYGDRATSQLFSFELSPDTNLTAWPDDGGSNAQYGASYAFVTYLVDREGLDLPAQLVADREGGIAGIDAVLRFRGVFENFAQVFDDWMLANFLDTRPPPASPWSYQQIQVATVPLELPSTLPIVGTGRVENYGAVYMDLPPMEEDATVTVRAVLDGDDGAPLRAALISWDSQGLLEPDVSLLHLSPPVEGGYAQAPPGYDRHTLVVWARGTEEATGSFGFRYSVAVDPPRNIQFLDVGGDSLFYSYIENLLERGIVNGQENPQGSGLWFFGPDDPVKRAQFAKMIVEATGLHTPEVDSSTTPTFSDVPLVLDAHGEPVAYPFDYVQEAAASGIVSGYEDGRFGPWDPIKRIQLVRMILRAATALGYPFPAYTGSEPLFADVPPTSLLYRDVMTAWQNGILSGALGTDGKRYFDPWSSAKRGQVAKMTSNLLLFLGL